MHDTAARKLRSPARSSRASTSTMNHRRPEAPFCVEDYVQLACTLRKSVRLTATSAEGADAEVVVYRGELWRAADEHGGGSAAFKRLLGRPCSVQVETLSEVDRGPRNVFNSWEQLLLLAAVESSAVPEQARESGSSNSDQPSPSDPESRVSGVRLASGTPGGPRHDELGSSETFRPAAGSSARPETAAPLASPSAGASAPPAANGRTPENATTGKGTSPRVPLIGEGLNTLERMFSFSRQASPSARPWSSRYLREVRRGARETVSEIGAALTELKNRPDRRQAFLAAGICACLAVLWLNFIQGEFRRLSTSPTSVTSTAHR